MEHEQQHHTATFEKINATLDRISEMQKKAALEMEKQRRAADKRMKKLEGMFTSQWGKLMESLVEGDLVGPVERVRDSRAFHSPARLWPAQRDALRV